MATAGWDPAVGSIRSPLMMTPVPSSSKRRRRSEDHTSPFDLDAGAGGGQLACTGKRALMDDVAWPQTPVTTGAASTHIATPMSVPSPMHSFHMEESLLVANTAKERFKRELDSALERTKELTTKLAGSEAREAALSREVAKLRVDMKKAMEEMDMLTASHASKQGSNEAEEELKQHADKLSKELVEARFNSETLKLDLEAARKEMDLLKGLAEKSYKDVSDKIASITQFPKDGGEGRSSAELEEKLREFRILNKQLAASLQEARKEATTSQALRREVESLRKERHEIEELVEKNRKLSAILAEATNREAEVRAERERLEHWRVSLSIGMPEQATPADVINAFKQLRAENLELEQKCIAWEERCRASAQQRSALQDAAKLDQGKLQDSSAQLAAKDRELIAAKASVERLQILVADAQLMEKSFRAEEIFVRDEEVKALQRKVAAMEQAQKAQAETAAAELARARAETERVRDAARKERDQALTAQTAANKAKSELQAALDQEKANAAAARTRSIENERVVRAKAVEAEKNLKLKAAEIEKLNSERVDELVKVKSEVAEQKTAAEKATKDKDEAEKKLNDTVKMYKSAVAKISKSEDTNRIWSALVGIHMGCTQKKAKDEKVAREYLVTVKNRLADKQETLFVNAVIQVEDKMAMPKLALQDNNLKNLTGPLPDLVAKHVTATVDTPAEHTGLPALIAETVLQEAQRIVVALSAGEAAAAGAATEGQDGGQEKKEG